MEIGDMYFTVSTNRKDWEKSPKYLPECIECVIYCGSIYDTEAELRGLIFRSSEEAYDALPILQAYFRLGGIKTGVNGLKKICSTYSVGGMSMHVT